MEDSVQQATPAPATPRKPEIEDLLRYRLVSDPQVSPDGTRVAYVQTRLRKKKDDYASNIWLLPLDGSAEPVRFTGSDRRDAQPRWSPDGKTLAFVSTRSGRPQLWSIPLGGGEATQLTRLKGGVSQFEWSPDGAWLLLVSHVSDAKPDAEEGGAKAKESAAASAAPEAQPAGEFAAPLRPAGEWREDDPDEEADDDAPKTRVVTRLQYKSDGEGFLEGRSHIFVIPASGGKPRQLTDGDWDEMQPHWSPDGARIAFLANREPDAEHVNIQDIFVVPFDPEQPAGTYAGAERVTRHDCTIAGYDWLRTADGFATFSHSRINEGALATNYELWTISMDGQTRSLTAAADRLAGSVINSDLRGGGGGESRPRFSADGKTIYFMLTSEGTANIFSVPAAGGEVSPVTGGPRHVLNFTLGPSGIVFAASTATLPNDLFAVGVHGEGERRLTDVNRDFLPEVQLSEPHEFWLEMEDGGRVQGWLLFPPGFEEGKKYPLILQIHGGPHVSYGHSFFHEFQLMAAHGNIVLYTNPRGSQGYGQKFSEAILNDWGGIDYRDLMACVDHVLSKGYVDEQRLGIAGGSYGGYMTAWVIGHTDRFKAACAMRMIANCYSAWGNADFTWMLWSWEFTGTPQERAEFYIERSPIAYADRITTPLLITHAEDDLRANIEQAEEMYVALKVRKREVKMVRFPSGGHDVSRSGKPSLRLERLKHIIEWFDHYLAEPQPGAEKGQEG